MKQTVDVKVPRSAVLNANDRRHWAPTGDRTRQLRTLGRLAGRSMYPVPAGLRVRIDVDVWKGKASHYDPANLYPSAKAIVDGLRDAGILADDDWKRVDGPHMHHGGVKKALAGRTVRSGHFVFTVTLEAIGGTL